ncbi:uncharacterized protein MONBRDRAFT_12244 [Monosiga brevicollis MX1]|uniref:Uncharacterized protein n=1 Tax=Monosiga brevicollis TaxID=81824 RepID=A9VBN5_MONBE|nr:uncharacterized protein MONBRDRAFT_12244 [Monosiga brevicollis MX1]EDQ85129.1 predicted protein [Monosiga brevicollis MX1]|eukprot:XP_001750133.1 hypothetical protein [Monosiga brevicollis MX1]
MLRMNRCSSSRETLASEKAHVVVASRLSGMNPTDVPLVTRARPQHARAAAMLFDAADANADSDDEATLPTPARLFTSHSSFDLTADLAAFAPEPSSGASSPEPSDVVTSLLDTDSDSPLHPLVPTPPRSRLRERKKPANPANLPAPVPQSHGKSGGARPTAGRPNTPPHVRRRRLSGLLNVNSVQRAAQAASQSVRMRRSSPRTALQDASQDKTDPQDDNYNCWAFNANAPAPKLSP